MKLQPIISALLITFLSTVFCSILMTLPGAYAQANDMACMDAASHHHDELPCHSESHNHHQISELSFQKDEPIIDIAVFAKTSFDQSNTIEVSPKIQTFLTQPNLYERVYYRIKHIQTRKQE